jgi:hypothetical protein
VSLFHCSDEKFGEQFVAFFTEQNEKFTYLKQEKENISTLETRAINTRKIAQR